MQILYLVLLCIILVSMRGFNHRGFQEKLLYIPYEVKHHHAYYRIVSHIFIHQDWAHLLFNLFTLYFLGEHLEMLLKMTYGEIIGGAHWLILFFGGGVFATLYSYYKHQDNSNYRSLGASGAVSSIVFAMIICNPQMELMIMFFPFPIKAYIFGPLYLLFEYYGHKKGRSGIAHDAHIGGALFGVMYIFLINFEQGVAFFKQFI